MAIRNTAETVFTGSAADLLAEYQKLREANRQQEQQHRELKRASKEAHDEEQRGLREAQRMYREIQTPLEQYREKVRAIEKAYESGAIDQETYNRQLARQKTLLRDAEDGHDGLILKVAGLAAGYVSVTAAVHAWKQANQEIIEQTEKMGRKFDEVFRKFRIQSGLRGLEGAAAQRNIEDVAVKMGVDVTQAAEVATQLVSSGVPSDQASGPAAEAVLGIMAASNARGQNVDSAGLVSAIAKYLNSQGMPLTAENFRAIGGGTQALFKDTNLQLADLPALAKEGTVFQGKLTVGEQFGVLSSLADIMPAAQAAVGMRNFVVRTSTAAAAPERVRALKEMGVKPEEVDFVGEDFGQVTATLEAGLSRLPPEKRAVVLRQLYGEEGMATVQAIINTRQQSLDRAGRFGDLRQLDRDIEHATSGRVAGAQRQRTRREVIRARQDEQGDMLVDELVDELEEQGRAPVSRWLARAAFRTTQILTDSADAGLGAGAFVGQLPLLGTGAFFGAQGNLAETVREDVKLLQRGASAQEATLEELRAMRQNGEATLEELRTMRQNGEQRESPAAAQSR